MISLKIGVFGVGRGLAIAKNFKLLNCEIVALCDNNQEKIQKAIEELNDKTIAAYDNFAEISHLLYICSVNIFAVQFGACITRVITLYNGGHYPIAPAQVIA